MSIEADLVTYVLADAAIAAKIVNRILPVFADHDPKGPYITYRRLSTDRDHTHSGPVLIPTIRFLLTSWDNKFDDAISLSDLVRKRLEAGGAQAWGSSAVKLSRVIDESDNFEPSPELLEKQYFGRDLTLEIRITET